MKKWESRDLLKRPVFRNAVGVVSGQNQQRHDQSLSRCEDPEADTRSFPPAYQDPTLGQVGGSQCCEYSSRRCSQPKSSSICVALRSFGQGVDEDPNLR